jgi:hypothetical protein
MVRQQPGAFVLGAQMTQSDGGGRVTVGPVTVRSKQPAVVTVSRSQSASLMYMRITRAGA